MWVDSSPAFYPMCFSDWPACCWDSPKAGLHGSSIDTCLAWTCIWPDPTCCICVSELKMVLVLFRFSWSPMWIQNLWIVCWYRSKNFDIWWLIGFYFCTIGLLKWSHYRHACLRLVLNEVLRCKPGSLIIMAPDCRSLSKMYLVFLDMVSYNMFDQLWKKSQIAP